jgi:hypothetical protein
MLHFVNTAPYLRHDVVGQRIVPTVGAGLVPALGTHKENVSKLGTHQKS